MKTQLNKDLVEGFSESSNETFVSNVNDFVFTLVTNALEDISERTPFVQPDKCVLQPVNEIILGAYTQLSEFDYFLGVDNVQIETNSKTAKNFWKNVWREFKASWRIGRKKKYKNKKKHQEEPRSVDVIEKYKISDFREDLVQCLSMYLSESSIITEYPGLISMIGKDDFGTNVRVNIFVTIFDTAKQQFKLYNEMRNKYLIVDFGNRFRNLDAKINDCGDMFVNMIKIFNALFSKTYNYIPNQILVESMIYNCPKQLFDQNDVFKTFVNVANYVRFINPRTITSICDGTKSIFEESLIVNKNSQIDFSKIINMLDRFNY